MKKILSVTMLFIMLLSMAGCSKNESVTPSTQESSNDNRETECYSSVSETETTTKDLSYMTIDTSNTEVEPEQYNSFYETVAEVYKNYINIPRYKGFEVEFSAPETTVTTQDIDNYITEILRPFATTHSITNGVTKKGDKIKINYIGKLDGKAIEGGTSTNETYTIGSNNFISDLDEGLVGLNVGQTYDITCTYPDPYFTPSLSGKTVIFTVTVLEIIVEELPALTDEWIAVHAKDLGINENTVDGFRKTIKKRLEDSAQKEYNSAKFNAIFSKITESADILDYPEKELESIETTIKTNVEEQYDSYSLIGDTSDFDSFLKNNYDIENEHALDLWITNNAQEFLIKKMIITVIAYDNKITVSADEIKELGKEIAESYQYESYDEIINTFGTEMNAEIGYEVLYNKVVDIVNSSNTVTIVE